MAIETGWRCNGKRRYLWAFVSPQVVFFNRSQPWLQSPRIHLGPSSSGTLGSDDHSAYRKYHREGIRQLCLGASHSKAQRFKGRPGKFPSLLFSPSGSSRRWGQFFTCWHAFRRVGLTRGELWPFTHVIRARMKRYILLHQKATGRSRRWPKASSKTGTTFSPSFVMKGCSPPTI